MRTLMHTSLQLFVHPWFYSLIRSVLKSLDIFLSTDNCILYLYIDATFLSSLQPNGGRCEEGR